jgi:hemerythrin-like domain-containing protein
MSGPLHTLKHEHRVIERTLRALDGVCVRLVWGEQVPADVLKRLVDFISGYADGFHHLKEETYLFPALQHHGIQRHGGALGLIEMEHANERGVTEEMRRAIEGYKEIDPNARQRFVEAAHRYSDLLLPHIEHEDSLLFRIADEVLDEEEIKSLSEAFKQAAAELGADRLEVYEKTAAELEETWGI